MKINDFLLKMWNDYCQLNPHINQVLNLIKAKEPNEIINDHIALRTFNHKKINRHILSEYFLKNGYKAVEDLVFTEKKLKATYFIHSDPSLPRIFISELLLENFSDSFCNIINKKIDEIDIKSSANNKLKSQSYTLNVYGSIQTPDKINLNALLGASFLSMDQLASGSVTGERNGKQIFTAITYEHQNPYSKFELIPFGKFDLGVNQFSEYTDFNSSTAGAERHHDLIFLTSNISGGFKFDNTLYLNDSSLNRNGFIEYIHDLTPDIDHDFINLADNLQRTKTLKKHSRSYLKGNIGFEYANSNGPDKHLVYKTLINAFFEANRFDEVEGFFKKIIEYAFHFYLLPNRYLNKFYRKTLQLSYHYLKKNLFFALRLVLYYL